MHAQWLKEWRLLRPGLVAAIALAVLPMMFLGGYDNRTDAGMMITLCMFLAGILLGIETFGREFHQQTSAFWLALPMSRAGLWRAKVGMMSLAVAGVVLLNGVLLLMFSTRLRGVLPNLEEVVRPAVAMSGGAALGLFWSMRLRQTWAALWMSLITPGALLMLIQLLVLLFWPAPERNLAADPPDVRGMFDFGFCLVGVLAFLITRQGITQLEDLGPAGEDVQIKAPRMLRKLFAIAALSDPARRSASQSLWRKEIRLQQVNLALAGSFAVMMVLVQVLRQVAMSMPERFGPNDIELFDVVWVLWSLLPLTIGLACLAEERRLGVDAWQETLPVSRRRRWWIKIGATYGLAFIIGVVVPVVGEKITRSGPVANMMIFHSLAWLIMTTTGIYVSSLARNLVHAISILVPFGVALVLALAGGLWGVALLGPGPIDRYAVVPSELHFHVVIGVLLFVVLLWLTWRNAVPGTSQSQGVVWRFNAATIAVVWLVSVLIVAGSRTRVWEWLRPEPAALPALSAVEGVEAHVEVTWGYVAVLTPDGNLWMYGSPGDMHGPVALQPLGAGQTWLSMGAGEHQLHAVRSDGTLWRWGQESVFDSTSKRWTRRGDLASSWASPIAIGSESNWQGVASTTTHSVGLKNDGTLWGWGNNLDGQLGETDTLYISEPVRIGTAADWTCIAVGQAVTMAANREGEVWLWGQGRGRRGADGQARFANPERIANGAAWNRLFLQGEQIMGRTVAGEVRVIRESQWMSRWQTPRMAESIRAREVILDTYEVWAIAEDGNLLHWYGKGAESAYTGRRGIPPVESFWRIGNREDWIAMDVNYGSMSFLGLTADGGLWTWGMEFGKRGQTWLPPSQRPRQVAMLRAMH